MRCSVNLLVVMVLLLATASVKSVAQEQHQVQQSNQLTTKHYSAEFKNKLYRQALFFYFSGNYAQALRQISVNKQRFNISTAKSALFNAGLQVSMGLQQQASKSLVAIAAQQSQPIIACKQTSNGSKSATSPDELLLIALLQLSEQQIQQGNNLQAQQSLAKIKQISAAYYQQYYTLNQLAYWPEAPVYLASISTINKPSKSNSENNIAQLSSPYIRVNQALLLIENNEYSQAETILLAVKDQPTKPVKMTFWQQLFSPFGAQVEDDLLNHSQNNSQNDAQLQQQAIADYAQLLLAQLYIKQQRFNDSFATLKSFPQHSPYRESALFLFAYAAQKTQHYQLAITLFNLVQQQYPYSNLGWQSALLKASQVAEPHQQNIAVPNTLQQTMVTAPTAEKENLLNQSLLNYQQLANLFTDKLNDLTSFEQAFLAANNLLNFSTKAVITTTPKQQQEQKQLAKKNIIDQLAAVTPYQTNSPWLQKALQAPTLKADYQYLTELDILARHLEQQKNKNQWLNYTLALNKNRQDNIFIAQQQHPIAAAITELKARRNKLSETLNSAEKQQKLQLLADAKQQQWLQSIAKGEDALTMIKTQRNITHYQTRLQRVKGVLLWQLSQQFIPRLWQHKTQLAAIDKQLALAQNQQQQFTDIANAHQSLNAIAKRQQKATLKLNALIKKIPQITAKANQQIKAQVQTFINQQRALLTANLLTAQHAMATILEKMSAVPPQANSEGL
jgi:hypothetical protein